MCSSGPSSNLNEDTKVESTTSTERNQSSKRTISERWWRIGIRNRHTHFELGKLESSGIASSKTWNHLKNGITHMQDLPPPRKVILHISVRLGWLETEHNLQMRVDPWDLRLNQFVRKRGKPPLWFPDFSIFSPNDFATIRSIDGNYDPRMFFQRYFSNASPILRLLSRNRV